MFFLFRIINSQSNLRRRIIGVKKRWIRKRIQNQIIFLRYINGRNLNNLKKLYIYIHIFILLYVFLIFVIAVRLNRYFQFRQIARDAPCNRMKLIRSRFDSHRVQLAHS